MVSHGDALSRRDEYVKELQKYIDIDIYGGLGNKSCTYNEDCYDIFQKEYLFYLSFENNFCRDYFTEKVTNPLRYEIVPVVMGGANYSRDLPPHSVIDILRYPSPRVLAGYLLYLSNNETAYHEYFQWKQRYTIRWDYSLEFHCRMCEYLHDSPYTSGETVVPSFGSNYTQWFQGTCDNSVMGKLRERGNW